MCWKVSFSILRECKKLPPKFFGDGSVKPALKGHKWYPQLLLKKTKNFAKRQYTWFENRFDQNLKVKGENNISLVVETFNKII